MPTPHNIASSPACPSLSVSGFVYLDVDVTTAQQRVAKRARTGESVIAWDYQNSLLLKHEQWLQSLAGSSALADDTRSLCGDSETRPGKQRKVGAVAVEDVPSPSEEAGGAGGAEVPQATPQSTPQSTPQGAGRKNPEDASGRVLRIDASQCNTEDMVKTWMRAIDAFIRKY